jgi:hypothetical protein
MNTAKLAAQDGKTSACAVPQRFVVACKFLPGDRVIHAHDHSEGGIVTAVEVYPSGFYVLVSGSIGESSRIQEIAFTSEEENRPRMVELPLLCGQMVLHRADARPGVVTGHRINDDGYAIRVAWGSGDWDWHEVCELEPRPEPGK